MARYKKYKYEVRDPGGHVSAGVVQAESLTDASSRLRGQGGYLLNVSPLPEGVTGLLERMRSVSFQMGPGLKDVQNFTNQLAVMIKAGIDIRTAVESIAEQIENVKFRKIIQQIKADVEAGQPFSEALRKHPKTFSPLYVNMVRASELSGSFGQMLNRISEYLAQQVETRNMVRGAMIYPCIIATMAVVTTIFLLTFVLPRFTTLFAGKSALLPAPTRILMGLSSFIRTYWYVLLGGVAAATWGFHYTIHTTVGGVWWDRFKLRMPLFRRMFRALYITRSLHTMSELISAGVPMLETLAITADVSGNAVYRRMWQSVHSAVKQGDKIAEPLTKHPQMPRNVIQMIAAGEESGKLGEVLRDVAEYYARELRNTIKTVTAMIEPIMIIIMGALVGFIAMSIILPIFKMSSLAK